MVVVTGLNRAARRAARGHGQGRRRGLRRSCRSSTRPGLPTRRAGHAVRASTRTATRERCWSCAGTSQLLVTSATSARPRPPGVQLVVAFRGRGPPRPSGSAPTSSPPGARDPLAADHGQGLDLHAADQVGPARRCAEDRHARRGFNSDADRVNRLLSDLLDASRIDAGRLRLRTQVVGCRRSPARSSPAGGRAARRTRSCCCRAPAAETWLDPDRVTQVLSSWSRTRTRRRARSASRSCRSDPRRAPRGVSHRGRRAP